MSFINKYGLINASEGDVVSENTALFTQEYLILAKEAGIDEPMLIHKMKEFIIASMVCPGLYNQMPGPLNPKDAYMSHDTLTGMLSFGKQNGMCMSDLAWNWIVTHYGTYDNVSRKTNFKKILHPRDFIFAALLHNSWIGTILAPLLFLIMVESCMSKYKYRDGNAILVTDGKLLSWVRCKTLGWNRALAVLQFLMSLTTHFKNFKDVFLFYFKEEGHPIRLILGEK